MTPADIDIASLYDAFTFSVLCQLEDFGFFPKGEAADFVLTGTAGNARSSTPMADCCRRAMCTGSTTWLRRSSSYEGRPDSGKSPRRERRWFPVLGMPAGVQWCWSVHGERAGPEALVEPFWESAARGVLSLQRCSACERFIHFPLAACPTCHSPASLEWRTVSGLGTLYSFIVVHRSRFPAFSRLPYVVGCVAAGRADWPADVGKPDV